MIRMKHLSVARLSWGGWGRSGEGCVANLPHKNDSSKSLHYEKKIQCSPGTNLSGVLNSVRFSAERGDCVCVCVCVYLSGGGKR